ncbi:MAG TPA: Hpt domain-containing protein [Actinocrinis sp.]|nr:Hpt domain-containing protein [Actinocrinis sp.]
MAIDPPCTRPAATRLGEAVDGEVRDDVHDVVGDEGMYRCLASFLRLLPERLESARLAAEAGQRSEAARLLAALRIGSGMFGACHLAGLAGAAEAALRGGRNGSSSVEWAPLSRHAEVVERELRRYLDGLGGGHGLGFGPPNR